MDKIEEFYESSNYPSATKLQKIMKKKGVDITLKQIQDFLSKQESEQVMKIQQKKKHDGHITASFPDEFWQYDIFVLDKYAKYNKEYKYIFCVIDVFTRKVYAVAMKNKDENTVVNALKEIVVKNVVLPTCMLSDSDSAFLSKKFTNLLKEYDIIQDTVPIGDHASLGIIDRFALTLKRILSKRREKSKDANWVDSLKRVIDIYNNTEHSSLLDLSPNEANKEENKELVLRLNVGKSKANIVVSDLEHGDKVRILEKSTFHKGNEAQWSSKIYIVDTAIGKTIYLTDGSKKKRNMLLKIDKDSVEKESITKKITREKRVEKLNRQAGVNEDNIRIGSRVKKTRAILDI